MYQIEPDQYVNFIKGFIDKPFNLSNAWVEYQKVKGNNVVFFADDLIQPQIICWARIKKVKFIGYVLDIQGPIFSSETSQKQLSKFLTKLRDLPYKGVFINSTSEYSVLFEEAIRKAHFKRPIGQSNTSLTIIVDVLHLNPDNNWRRNLKKAAKVDFEFEVKQNVTFNDCLIIDKLHKENSELKKLSYQLKANEIEKLCNSTDVVVCFLKQQNKHIAARIISLEENISHDIFACNSLLSRHNGATQFLMQNIFEYLASKNIQFFDFSRIPIGKKGAQGVYDFKRSTRGQVIQYNGEWVFFKNERLRHLYYLYNLFFNKKDFY